MTYKKNIWSGCERMASWLKLGPQKRPGPTQRKVISVDFKDHELRVVASLVDTGELKTTSGIDWKP